MPLTAGQVFGLQIQTIWDFIPLTTAGTLEPSLEAPRDLAGYASLRVALPFPYKNALIL